MTQGRPRLLVGARRRWASVLVLPLVAMAVLAGCSSTASQEPPKVIDKATPYADLLVPKLAMSVKDGAVGVPVDAPVTVTAGEGVLGTVTMVNSDGKEIAGEVGSDGVSWSTTEPLGYDKQYTLTADARGLGGVARTNATFRTHSPDNMTMPYVMPGDGEVVGIGQTVAIRFDESIPNRAAAEKAIKITTNPPVEGAFYWLNNREVRWRPEAFWEPGTSVDVKVNTYGVDLGNGVFGQDNVTSRFAIGDAIISRVDDNNKVVNVERNGEIIKTMPTSMGKDKAPTNNGTYIIGERFKDLIMDSSTYGVAVNSPDGYRTKVQYATQMSYSGIYVHAAPWSVGAQGRTNTSHGCLNVSTANAKWFYENTKRGDIVIVSNTVGPVLPGTEGLGDWNIPWSQWKAGNARQH
ncbi:MULTISPECIES: Ig-like domain-containing protein [unclassified Mycobacterium]|uniref:L,D-transpeptidase n=1 Tax=unclassified Mycobacterium TaxID=2642494 RepID=UPI0009930765|nr:MULTISPECIES: Ig-like domain-containing protein [unclassified Mycobacterium]